MKLQLSNIASPSRDIARVQAMAIAMDPWGPRVVGPMGPMGIVGLLGPWACRSMGLRGPRLHGPMAVWAQGPVGPMARDPMDVCFPAGVQGAR